MTEAALYHHANDTHSANSVLPLSIDSFQHICDPIYNRSGHLPDNCSRCWCENFHNDDTITLTATLCNSRTTYIFDINVCEISGTAATVTAVDLYYTNNANFEDATTKGVANAVTLGASASAIAVNADSEASNSGATVTIATDAACSSYTHICAVIATTNDINAANDDACIALAGGTTSTSNCQPDACTDPGTVANAQSVGSSFAHRSTVTYTCNAGFHLVGARTLTCYDGKWDHNAPTCSLPPRTTARPTTKRPTKTKRNSGENAEGLYSLIATVTFACIVSFW
ncbi:uncharacterized protein [Ptychodera flava]|uniref:uncharacterized protein n=1 Tax=Ptychodera flava TaxID=63121 RepID=UPI00396A7310